MWKKLNCKQIVNFILQNYYKMGLLGNKFSRNQNMAYKKVKIIVNFLLILYYSLITNLLQLCYKTEHILFKRGTMIL